MKNHGKRKATMSLTCCGRTLNETVAKIVTFSLCAVLAVVGVIMMGVAGSGGDPSSGVFTLGLLFFALSLVVCLMAACYFGRC